MVHACIAHFPYHYNYSLFLHNKVSLPHYQDNSFISKALDRYRKFVHLKKMYPQESLVPMYDIDLLWHTHMLYPEAYCLDTLAYLGKILNHDDSSNSRTKGSKRNLSEIRTKQLWLKTYKTPLSIPGTMYRGEHRVSQKCDSGPILMLIIPTIFVRYFRKIIWRVLAV